MKKLALLDSQYMTILGIDPGLATTGYAIIKLKKKSSQPRLNVYNSHSIKYTPFRHLSEWGPRSIKVVDFGCITTKANLPFENRLKIIHQELKKVIKKYKPNVLALEELFFCKNVKTALKVGEARGVILLTAIEEKLKIYEFTPLEVKQAITSYGRAEKIQVQRMLKVILNLRKIPKPDDAADALAVAVCCANSETNFYKS